MLRDSARRQRIRDDDEQIASAREPAILPDRIRSNRSRSPVRSHSNHRLGPRRRSPARNTEDTFPVSMTTNQGLERSMKRAKVLEYSVQIVSDRRVLAGLR